MGWDLQREDATISNATAVVAAVVVVVDDAVRWLPMRCGALQVASHPHGSAEKGGGRYGCCSWREEGDTDPARRWMGWRYGVVEATRPGLDSTGIHPTAYQGNIAGRVTGSECRLEYSGCMYT